MSQRNYRESKATYIIDGKVIKLTLKELMELKDTDSVLYWAIMETIRQKVTPK